MKNNNNILILFISLIVFMSIVLICYKPNIENYDSSSHNVHKKREPGDYGGRRYFRGYTDVNGLSMLNKFQEYDEEDYNNRLYNTGTYRYNPFSEYDNNNNIFPYPILSVQFMSRDSAIVQFSTGLIKQYDFLSDAEITFLRRFSK